MPIAGTAITSSTASPATSTFHGRLVTKRA